MTATRGPYDELADRIRRLAREEARAAAPPVERWKVVRSNPITITQLAGDETLEEGGPDVEFDRALLTARPAVGDTVRVHHDGQDWIVSGVVV